MKAVSYIQTGEPDVLTFADVAITEPGTGEVRVAYCRSGVNPADWRTRRGSSPGTSVIPARVPGNDGAGIVDAVGEGVDRSLIGSRVWVWEAATTGSGSCQEFGLVRSDRMAALPDSASYDLGASLGVPFLTAHRCLTVGEDGPGNLGPGTLSGRTVLVAGGAGAVGNAAIQLARWSGATVISTVSGLAKSELAKAAGAHVVIDYTIEDVAERVREVSPAGVDTIAEVAPVANSSINEAVLGVGGTIAIYATDGGADLKLSFVPLMMANARIQVVMAFGVPAPSKMRGVSDINVALAAGAIGVGADHGLPLHHFRIEDSADAHAAVEAHSVGKVLIDVRDKWSGR
ncbi:NADPH:quinone reductase [Rhodococcus sp. KBS0724]|uniref:NADPH:quinone reductase n=1 Tax=Rhodococcus sp. KBS0724 TaxID=1179674 RepID=UPI00110F5988|nr:NADPH:quinone reductase [Rhodococcus sp. KBS0724]TSD40337.1 NADPH:quinone reductase [Rhodococcus sp. KBS0724]